MDNRSMNFPNSLTDDINFRLSHSRESSSWGFLLIFVITALTFSLIYFVERQVFSNGQLFFILTMIPVLLTSFFYGLIPGLMMATFCSAIFIPRIIVDIQTIGLSTSAIQFLAYLSFLHVLAYFVADMVNAMRNQASLSTVVRDWDALLTRASNIQEMIIFLLTQSQKICLASDAVFLLHNPLDAQWEAITPEDRRPLGTIKNGSNHQLSFFEWILLQENPIFLNQLKQDRNFLLPHQNLAESLDTFLAYPFIHRDGSKMGWLVLLNKEDGTYSQSDIHLLKDLVAAGERTLEQAGLFAQTDFALAKQVEQLAIIQRMARELNSILNAERIVERALECVLDITNGEGGWIGIDVPGLPKVVRFRVDGQISAEKEELISNAIALNRVSGESPAKSDLPNLLSGAKSRLKSWINGGGEVMGIILVESSRGEAFNDATEYFLSILADHTGIALENARLFNVIQREKQRMDLIFHSVADGLLTTDMNGTILTMNPAAEHLTGWGSERGIGRHFCNVIGLIDDDSIQHDCVLDKAMKEGKFKYEDRHSSLQHVDGNKVIALSIAPLINLHHQPDGAVVLFRDITRQDELDRLQKELIASISHELRTPLANIKSVAELLGSEEIRASEDDSIQDYLDILGAQSQRLSGFLETILDVHRLESGQMSLQLRPLPISLMIENAVRQSKLTDGQHDVKVNLPEKILLVWADENAVLSVLGNLMDNATKYSAPGTKVELTVAVSRSREVVVSIRDEGVGIPPEYQSRIFERFYRINGGDAQSIYGHGLGLYITRGLVEKMGGRIWVNSEKGKGSTFSFSLPVVEA